MEQSLVFRFRTDPDIRVFCRLIQLANPTPMRDKKVHPELNIEAVFIPKLPVFASDLVL